MQSGYQVSIPSRLLAYRRLRNTLAAAARPVVGTARDTRAGVAILLAFSLMALAAATGAALDFGRALNFKLALQGAADAASLAGATEYLNTASSSSAETAATNYINNAIPALPPNNGVTTTITTSVNSGSYNVVVNASASIKASFLGVIENTIPVSVTSTATSTAAPNINFYLLLDSSPSMGIAATTAGINTMVSNTQYECDSPPSGGSTCGCAFACHESHPSGESHCNATTCGLSGTGNPSGEDNYALAKSLGVSLRIDSLRSATQSLMTTAQNLENSNNAKYQMGIYTFDVNFNTIQTMTSSLSLAQSSAANIQQLEVYQNNMLTSSNSNSDEDTNYDNAMSSINSLMPNPGNGTNASGDTPKEVLLIVTDGVEDEYRVPTLNPTSDTPGRQQYLMNSNTDWCTQIKNRGIKIAILYTEYLPIPNNGWYANFDGSGAGISSFQSQIATQLQNCASSPSDTYFLEVTPDENIATAMQALFESAVQTAYLSK